jgi:hypothetical protein
MGFSGSFQHFRRHKEGMIDLLTFQFSQWGGSFVVEVASCPDAGGNLSSGEHVPPNKV